MKSSRIDKLIRNLDWNLLYTYTVICEEKSITLAAERLFLRQPTISNALKRLEEYLDCTLIERRKGSFSLTESGHSLYQQARMICDQVGNMVGTLQGSETNVSGHVTIAMASHVFFEPFDNFLTQFHKNHPNISYSIDIMTSADVANAVKSGEVATGICLVHRKRRGLNYTHMYREYFGFYCGPPHSLFGKKKLSIKDLQDLPIVSFNTDRLLDVLRPVALYRNNAQLEGKIIGLSSSLEEVRRMINCGFGYGPLPYHVVKDLPHSDKLWQLPPYKNLPAVDAYLVTQKNVQLTSAELTFQNELMAMLEGLNENDKNLSPT